MNIIFLTPNGNILVDIVFFQYIIIDTLTYSTKFAINTEENSGNIGLKIGNIHCYFHGTVNNSFSLKISGNKVARSIPLNFQFKSKILYSFSHGSFWFISGDYYNMELS